ncbi:serine/threonine-protein kinase [Gordonia sp. VNK1]|uniref:serine/threonine-protein kinase n=1 Tax=Gordonia oleivorans TaxID=3156618 RepID=UPI0032B38F8D
MFPSGTDRAGTMLGQYRLEELLGRGGMGEVYRATDTRRGRTVAIKLLSRTVNDDPTARDRFIRESHMAAALNDPHVIPIHDWGTIDGQLFIDMRLVNGRDLRQVLAEDGPLPPERALHIVEQIGAALDAAHQEGLTHRDVKPDNILVDRHDFAYLVDFGLAMTDSDTRFTQAGYAIGSFRYMAPERFADDTVGPPADIYALTGVLYECLSGQAPFAQLTNPEQIISAHLQQFPAPLNSPVNAVIGRGMAKDPADRHPDAATLVADARRAVHQPPAAGMATAVNPAGLDPAGFDPAGLVSAPPQVPTARPTTEFSQPTVVRTAREPVAPIPTQPVRGTSRASTYALIAVIAVLVIALLGVGGWFLTTTASDEPAENAAAPSLPASSVVSAPSVVPSQVPAPLSAAPSAPVLPANGRQVWRMPLGNAVVILYLSPSGYNWLEVATPGGLAGSARIWSQASGWQASPSYSAAPQQFFTPAVYAPANTCIRIIVNYAGNTMNRKIC